METGWIKVFVTTMEYQAFIARDLLETSGIKAVVLNQKDSTYLTFGEFVVYVPEESEMPALESLKELAS